MRLPDAHAITAGVLRGVERFVRAELQVRVTLATPGSRRHDADARRDPDLLSIGEKAVPADPIAEPFGEVDRALTSGIGQQDRELFAARARDHVACARRLR